MRISAIFAACLLAFASSARAGGAGKKRVIQGAPIYVDQNGNRIAPPPTAPLFALKPVLGAPAPSSAPAAAPVPAAAPARADAPFAGALSAWYAHPLTAWLLTLAVLIFVQRLTRRPRASFAVEPDCYAPGQTVKGTLLTEKRPENVKAVLELYRENDDRPARSVPVSVGQPAQADDGWRTAVAAVLPDDARPDFAGGWAFSVEGSVNGRAIREGDNVELSDFYLIPRGPYAPGAALRAILHTAEKPEGLVATLELERDDDAPAPDDATEPTDDPPERSVTAAIGEPERASVGWRTVVTATLPADAAFDFEGGWILSVEGRAGAESVLGVEAVDLA